MAEKPLPSVIVGCGGMGRALARIMAGLPQFALVAGCDLQPAMLDKLREELPQVRGYPDYAAMLTEVKPEVVIVATNNISHAALTIQAARAGAKGVYCEKPMAVNYGDAKAMLAACRQHGTALVVNHQRRLLPLFRNMQELMAGGAIGKIEIIRAGCAGDVLSDVTHLIDTIRHLHGDAEVKSVFGQVYRQQPDPNEARSGGFDASGGWRYGHPVETGAMAVFEFVSGVRVELMTGRNQPGGRWYQDYEIFGSQGRLWRNGDQADLFIQTDDQPGWRKVELNLTPSERKPSHDAIADAMDRFAATMHTGATHPMSGDSALKDQEIVMAIYESARLHRKIELPLQQDRFPLEIMIEKGEL